MENNKLLNEFSRLWDRGNYDGLMEIINEYLIKTPDDPVLLSWKARYLFETGDKESAQKIIDKILKQNPRQADALRVQGVFLVYKNDILAAIKNFDEAIAIDPNFSHSYSSRAQALFNQGEMDAALRDYTEAIRLNPQYVSAYTNRGLVYASKGDLKAAICDYNEAIRLDPEYYATVYYYRGNIYANKGDLNAAICDYTKAIDLNRDFAQAYSARGIANYKKDNLDAAIDDCTEAIRLNPQDSAAFNERGCAYYCKGNIDSAIRDGLEATRLDPKDPTAFDSLSIFYRKTGNIKEYLRARSTLNEIELSKMESEDLEYQFAYDCIFQTISTQILPILHTEKFIDYWFVKMEWGIQNGQTSIYNGNSSFIHQASYGAGFVAMTDKSLWIASLGKVSRRLIKGDSLFVKGLMALFRSFDFSNVEKEDKFFQFPYQNIKLIQKNGDAIIVKTDLETWTMYSIDDQILFPAISLAFQGEIKDIFSFTPSLSTSSLITPTPNRDVFNQIEELKRLLDLGALTQQEYDEKKKELLLKI